jgi:hypothetical protein
MSKLDEAAVSASTFGLTAMARKTVAGCDEGNNHCAHFHDATRSSIDLPSPSPTLAAPITMNTRSPFTTRRQAKDQATPHRRCPCGKLWWGNDAPFSEHFCAGDSDQLYGEGFSTSSAPLFAQWSETRAHIS